jgi:hypothetical protein
MHHGTCNLVHQIIRSLEAANRLAPDRFAMHASLERIHASLGRHAPNEGDLLRMLRADTRFVVSDIDGVERYLVSLAH